MKKSEKKDSDLVIAFQQGDKSALSDLMKRWHVHFCKFAYWYCKDSELAKDIAQESWTVIIKKINTLQNPNKFKSWAISIVNRKSVDFLRAKKREQNKLQKFHSEKFNDFAEYKNDEGLDDKDKIKKKLLDAITQLPINQQVVLKLFYTEDYTLKEIGKQLNISLGTAKSRLFHAREKLKTNLKNKNYEN